MQRCRRARWSAHDAHAHHRRARRGRAGQRRPRALAARAAPDDAASADWADAAPTRTEQALLERCLGPADAGCSSTSPGATSSRVEVSTWSVAGAARARRIAARRPRAAGRRAPAEPAPLPRPLRRPVGLDGGAELPPRLQRLPHLARRRLGQHRVAARRRRCARSAPTTRPTASPQAVADAVERSGFREYYHPRTGSGHGEHRFGWSTLCSTSRPGFPRHRGGSAAGVKLLVVTPEPIDAPFLRETLGEDVKGAEVLVLSPATNQSKLAFWVCDPDDAIAEATTAETDTVERLEEEGIDAAGAGRRVRSRPGHRRRAGDVRGRPDRDLLPPGGRPRLP